MGRARRFSLPTAAIVIAATWSPAAAQPSDGPAIDGPPPPVPPAVVTRDAPGRVTVRAVRLDEPLVLDGRLDERVYETVPAISDFIQQEPHEGQPATERTEAWILFDDRHLYIAARCWDSQPDRIVANELRRDHFNIFQNDNFTVVVDTFYDRRSGFFFQTNPLGALRDQEVADERSNNTDWNTVWHVATGRFEHGWTLEMAIPFKSLRYRSSGAQIWGINLRRVVRSRNEHSYLSLVPASYGVLGIYKFSSAATLVGLDTPAVTRNLELKPYAISSVATSLDPVSPFSNRVAGDAGFDVKYGLTRGLIADFTYNTDFAQVEEDEQQVNLTRFSLFFPEKREFFLEGHGIFGFGGGQQRSGGPGSPGSLRMFSPSSTPILFFSRRIGLSGTGAVPIQAGARLTGRAGKFAVGLLNLETDAAPAAGAVATNFSVVRVRRDVLRRSAIGFIGTRRSPSLDRLGTNEAAGVDAAFAFYQNLNITGYYARTWSPGLPDRESASYRAEVDYAGDRYGLQVQHLAVEPNFNPEVGFLRRENFRRSFIQGRFSPRPARSRHVRKYNWEISGDYFTDAAGRLETRELQGTSRTEFHNGGRWTVDYTRNLEVLRREFPIAPSVTLPPGRYRFQDLRSVYEIAPQRRLTGAITLSYGSFYSGTRTQAGYRGRVEITPRVSVEPGVSVNWVDLPQGRFTTRLVSTRATVTFTPRSALSSLVQYNSSANTAAANVRFRWEYVPGSDLFVVYSEGRDTSFGGFPGLANRTFVIKLTRLVRF